MKLPTRHRNCATVIWLAMAAACGALVSIGIAALPPGPPLSFQRLTIQDGLPGVPVNCVFEDSQGFLWFGTNEGLVRYDGHEMRIFREDVKDPHALGDRQVNDLKEDAHGNLWVATENGLDFWTRATEQFSHFQKKSNNPTASLSHNFCRCLLLDPDGSLWIGTDGGLNHFDARSGKWELFLPEPGQPSRISDKFIRCLLRDRKGMLWIGTKGGGLNQFDPQTGRFRVFSHDPNDPRSLSHQQVSALAEDPEGNLWVGTDGGLCRLDPEREFFERFRFKADDPGALQAKNVDAVLVDRAGMVWAGTDGGGLSRLDPVSRQLVHHRYSRHNVRTLASDVVRTLFQDRQGDLWVGHFPMGVSHLNRLTAGFLSLQALPGVTNGLSDEHVRAFWEDPSGDLWIGTDKGGLNLWEAATGRWKVYQHDSNNDRSLGHNGVLSLQRDRRGDLWVGTWNGGLNRFEPDTGTFHRYLPDDTRPNALSSPRVFRLLEDKQGQLWAVPNSTGVERFVPEEDGFAHYRHVPGDPNSLLSDFVWSLMEDRAGGLWAGTGIGLTRRNPATGCWEQWQDTTGPKRVLNSYPIVDMLEDRDGLLWACTQGGGLWRLDPRTGGMEGLHMSDGLPSDDLCSLLEDDDGILWVASNNGLARVDPRTRQIRTFDEESGLPSRIFSRHARLRLRSGELVFGTTQGFVKFQPRDIQPNTNPPPVVWKDLEVFNQRVIPGAPGSILKQSLSETRRLEIPARLSMLTFHFAVLNYRSPQLNRCRYQLEGFDKEWRDPGPNFRATYTNLDPGTYRLRVKAANNDGVWNEAGASLELIIVPPWWRTWWFRSAAVLLVLGVTAGVGATISTRRTRARLLEMERESQLAREREQAQAEREKAMAERQQALAEREQARDERERLQNQLTQAQKMESIGRLAGGVAHDFNNMLQAILGNAAIAMMEAPDSPSMREPLEEIQKAARRSADLTRQLLAFARQQTIRPVALDLNETVAGMLKMLQRLVDANIRLTFTPGTDLWTVKIDPSQVDQILANLVVNAHHAITGQGAVTIVTTNLTIDPLYAGSHPEAIPGDYVVLSVSDTGSGMTAETKAHLFEPFFTTKTVGKGTGLGLATVYGIVKQNQGFINVYSEPGKGAMFRIHLPRCQEAAALAGPTQPSAPPHGQETILLVEDEPQILIVCERTLQRLGYRVLSAGDPSVAAAIAAAHTGEIHLLLTDIIMPTMNGHELLQTLRKTIPELRCVFMSGYAADTFTQEGIIPVGIHFLSKPFTAESLATTIRTALKLPA
jgi:ligand-binding sensor domain-containing protein/signal transduction histidine kinase